GACLLVAVLNNGGGLFGGDIVLLASSEWGLIISASLGSFLVMLAVIAASLRIKNTMAILIIGIMFSALTGAIVSLLSYFTSSEQLQRYVFWSFGSIGNLSPRELLLLFVFWITGLILCIFCLKGLNALLLGENYARSIGTDIRSEERRVGKV